MAGGDGDVAVRLQLAIMAGVPYPPPGVPDTPANKQLYQDIAKEIETMPGGVLPEIPADWSTLPEVE